MLFSEFTANSSLRNSEKIKSRIGALASAHGRMSSQSSYGPSFLLGTYRKKKLVQVALSPCRKLRFTIPTTILNQQMELQINSQLSKPIPTYDKHRLVHLPQ